jgi:syntaxin 5
MYGAHVASARDRTSEFSALVERLQVRSFALSFSSSSERPSPSSQSIQLNRRRHAPDTSQPKQAAAGASTSGQNGTWRPPLLACADPPPSPRTRSPTHTPNPHQTTTQTKPTGNTNNPPPAASAYYNAGTAAASTGSGGGTAASAARAAVAQRSEFARRASALGLAIHRTSAKLQRLAALAKRTSAFDDPSREIDELTGAIKGDIQGLNAGIRELQALGRKGIAADNRQSAQHSETVVEALNSRLKDATLEFKDVLTQRTETVRADTERRALFSSTAERTPLLGAAAAAAGPGPSSSLAAAGAGGPFAGGPLGAGGGAFGGGGLGLGGGAGGAAAPAPTSAAALFGGGGAGAASGGSYLQQQLVLPQQQQDGYLSSRAEALHNVETTIVELGTIFTQLAEMVHAQGEMTQRIDENVEEALGNVDAAKQQLMRYLATISTNRWLVLKVFGVLLAFILFFTLFVA